ncbi:MAG: glycosyl hydrolase family 65 protein, partial [Verrucomicrobiota bacterium]
HSACHGGCWMTVVNGFAGMRDTADGLEFNPTLPDAWKGYSFPMVYKGTRFHVSVDAEGARYEWLSGPPLRFKSNGRNVEL